MSDVEANSMNCSELSACDQATPIAVEDEVKAEKTIKKVANRNRNETNKCSVCKKTTRGDNLKRHIIRKHSAIPNSNQIKNVVRGALSRKDYHKTVECSACSKTTRNKYLKKRLIAKHKDVWSTTGAVKKQSTTNGNMSFNSFDRKVTTSAECAIKTVTNTLNWAFKHIHDEAAACLESKGCGNDFKRKLNILAPVGKKLNNMIEQETNRVTNRLILESGVGFSK